MPEMLEVELYRRDVEPLCGSTIHQVDAPDAHWARHALDVADAVAGRRLLATRRHGKVLLLDTDGPTVALRFGMTGRLLVDGRSGVGSLVYGAHGPDPAWRRLTLSIGDSDVVVSDPRRLGWVELDPPLDDLGPDVGDAHGDALATVLTQRCGSSRVAVKAALLDQSRVAGLGNMLADEVLLRAGISPLRPCRSLEAPEWSALASAIDQALPALLATGGSHSGLLSSELRVEGQPCPLDGTPLTRTVIGGRSAYHCSAHQR